jgi:hypothetical protein
MVKFYGFQAMHLQFISKARLVSSIVKQQQDLLICQCHLGVDFIHPFGEDLHII